jgi:predicted GIY-YIG superfamily endonuclease
MKSNSAGKRWVVKEEGRTWVVYVLRCPMTGEAKYVGQTYNTQRRMRQHLHGDEPATKKWVADLKKIYLQPVMHIVEKDLPRKRAFSAETEWVEGLTAAGANLINISAVRWQTRRSMVEKYLAESDT